MTGRAINTSDLERYLSQVEARQVGSLINNLLKPVSHKGPADISSYCEELSSCMQQVAKSETRNVEKNINEFKNNAYYLMTFGEDMRQDLEDLKKEFSEFHQQLNMFSERDKQSNMLQLVKVNRLVQKLEETNLLLKQAKEAQEIVDRLDVWETTTDTETLGAAISTLQTSLGYLKKIPQSANFEKSLHVMIERFRNLVRPLLHDCFLTGEVGIMHNVWELCEKTDQKESFAIQLLWKDCWTDVNEFVSKQQEVSCSFNDRNDYQAYAYPCNPEAVSCMRNFYEQVLMSLTQQVAYTNSAITYPSGVLIASSLTQSFSSLEPSLPNTFHISFSNYQKDHITKEWKAPLESYYHMTIDCLNFVQQIARLLYQNQCPLSDIHPCVSSVIEPAIRFLYSFPMMIDELLQPLVSALVIEKEAQLKNYVTENEFSTMLLSLCRHMDALSCDSFIIGQVTEVCQEWTGGSQFSGIGMAYLQLGRFIQQSITDKVMATQRKQLSIEDVHKEMYWNTATSTFRLMLSIFRLGRYCWQVMQDGIQNCQNTINPTLQQHNANVEDISQALEQLCFQLIQSPSIESFDFLIVWYCLTQNENLDCIQYRSIHIPLFFLTNTEEKAHDPFEETMFFLRQVLLEILFDTIDHSLSMLFHSSDLTKEENECNYVEASSGLAVPTFGSSPQSTMIQIGEHLLIIPQILETLVPSQTSEMIACLPRHFDCEEWISIIEENSDVQNFGRNDFVQHWVQSIGIWTMITFVEKLVSREDKIGTAGIKQLCIDMEYLVNIMTALGVPMRKEFSLVQQLLIEHIASHEVQKLSQDAENLNEKEAICHIGQPLTKTCPTTEEIQKVIQQRLRIGDDPK
eukprot:jgi/Galph1/1542/GphlegSOOS_G215.1